jgi:hypothetical protein
MSAGRSKPTSLKSRCTSATDAAPASTPATKAMPKLIFEPVQVSR